MLRPFPPLVGKGVAAGAQRRPGGSGKSEILAGARPPRRLTASPPTKGGKRKVRPRRRDSSAPRRQNRGDSVVVGADSWWAMTTLHLSNHPCGTHSQGRVE